MAATRVEVPGELVAFAGELADAAGAVILRYWRTPIEVVSKMDAGRPVAESPVTAADRGAEEAMRALIAARYPAHAVVGEECGTTGDPDTAEWTWVLDPVDGTKSFITGKPLFGTLIALLRFKEPALGVVDQCVLKERWVGANGATTLNSAPARAAHAPEVPLGEAMVYATTPEMFAPGFEARAFAGLRKRVKRTLYGCDCYAYALCASGFVGLVCEADLQPYDYLALVPVVAGAGGKITDWRGAPLGWGDASGGRVLAAATPELHAAALAALATPPRDDRLLVVAAAAALGALLGALAARARR